MTVLQDIRDAVIAALNASGSPLEFTKRRWEADSELEEQEFRGAVLFHVEQSSRAGGPGSTTRKREHNIAVQVVTAVADPADIDDALEPAREWVVSKLGDNTLGGLVHGLEEVQTAWETATISRMHGAFTIQWRIDYQTRADNLNLKH